MPSTSRSCVLPALMALSAVALPAAVLAQAAAGGGKPEFDVISIHASAPDAKARVELRGDRFVATAVTVWDLVKLAYPSGNRVRNDDQIAAAPAWVHTTRFDIMATGAPTAPEVQTQPGAVSPRESAALTDARAMLQALLADRFGLEVHHERRELSAYALRRHATDRLGPQLHRAGACTPDRTRPPDPGVAPCGGFSLASPNQLSAHAVTIPMLVSLLSNLPVVGRVVNDQTGLSGVFDLVLRYSRDLPGEPADGTATNAPSIFTALQEQLGLRLEPIRTPMDIVVIGEVHAPYEN